MKKFISGLISGSSSNKSGGNDYPGSSSGTYPGAQSSGYPNPGYNQPPNNYYQQPQGVPPQGYYSQNAPQNAQDQYAQAQSYNQPQINGYNQPQMNGYAHQQPSNGTKSELRGCIADVRNVHDWLIANYGFHEICILTDDSKDPRGQPTRQNIINGMRWLVRDACPGDAFFFHFSGHGSRVKDQDGDEADGYDETICPVDYATAGQIVDDEIHNLLVKPLPPGSRLTAIFDCCHSGSAMDLPFTYSVDGREEITFQDNTKQMISHGMNAGIAMLADRPDVAFREAKNLFSLLTQKHDANAMEKTKREKTSPAHVVQFSGCKDNQTSADAVIGGQATGAMSWALITALNQNRHRTYTDLLRELRRLLQGKYQQIPQMSTSHPWNVAQDVFTIA